MSGKKTKKRTRRGRATRVWPILAVCVLVAAGLGSVVLLFYHFPSHTTVTSAKETTTSGAKYTILYINQGNGVVNESNFGSMLSFASSQGFNTIFFQVYRAGALLFDSSQLGVFVDKAHAQSIKIFFSLYFTNGTQQIPTMVYGSGEDGISLDMSTLPLSQQSGLFASLRQGYASSSGLTAITTTDRTLPLSPDLLVLETYGSQIEQYSQYIHPGVIAGVGVFATTSHANYQQEYTYALANSDGVMVFDYAGLLKAGY